MCVDHCVLFTILSSPLITAEQALKARKEIADYIKSGRIERARIRVSGGEYHVMTCHC